MLKPTERSKHLAVTYWKQSADDLKQAEKYLKKNDFYQAAMLSTQSAINALTSICLAKGVMQHRSFSVAEMVTSCVAFNASFADLMEIGGKMDDVQAFSPYGTSPRVGSEVTSEMVEPFPGWAKEIRKACKTYISGEKLF